MNLRQPTLPIIALLLAFGASAQAVQSVVDFDDLTLGAESHWAGPDPNSETVEGLYGPEIRGEFVSHGVAFVNSYGLDYGISSGFAYSNQSDNTTPGHTNQFSAVTGDGRGPDADNYAVASALLPLDDAPVDAASLNNLPTLHLPFGRSVQSVWITNTTYAALSMRDGDTLAKVFGGDSGDEPDWFKTTAYGIDAAGAVLATAIDFYLADFRSANSAEDYIVNDWMEWDLSPLAGAVSLHFDFSSSDAAPWGGFNTPAYFAMDDLTLNVDVTPGDYNLNGLVDAADYTVWRDALDTTVPRRGVGADGDLSGVVDQADWSVWANNYGSAAPTSIPEPAAILLIAIGSVIATTRKSN